MRRFPSKVCGRLSSRKQLQPLLPHREYDFHPGTLHRTAPRAPAPAEPAEPPSLGQRLPPERCTPPQAGSHRGRGPISAVLREAPQFGRGGSHPRDHRHPRHPSAPFEPGLDTANRVPGPPPPAGLRLAHRPAGMRVPNRPPPPKPAPSVPPQASPAPESVPSAAGPQRLTVLLPETVLSGRRL